MEIAERRPRRSRRSFLKLAVTAGGFVVPALGMASSAVLRAPVFPGEALSPVVIGVLVPEFSRHTALGTQLVDGMRLAFNQIGMVAVDRSVTLRVERYTSPSHSLVQARALLADDAVTLLTGFVSPNEVNALDPLLRERGTPFIVSDVGANVIHQPQQSERVFRSSLNHWQANLQLGMWAAVQRGQRVVIATSFYEAGYDALYAFRYGFEQAGGTVVATHVTHAPNSTVDLRETLRAIGQYRPDVVYAAYSGNEAAAFVNAYATAGLAGTIPLIGAGLLTDEQVLPLQGSAAQGITSIASWSPELATSANRRFMATFAAATGRQTDSYAVLGYDTAALIRGTLAATGGSTDSATFRQALGSVTVDGPRGVLALDSALWEAASPLYLREVQAGAGGYRNAIIGQLGSSAALHKHAAALRNPLRSGWLYPYMSS